MKRGAVLRHCPFCCAMAKVLTVSTVICYLCIKLAQPLAGKVENFHTCQSSGQEIFFFFEKSGEEIEI